MQGHLKLGGVGPVIPKNVGNYYVLKDMDIYYLHLIMDCHWRSAGSGANLKHCMALLLMRQNVCLFSEKNLVFFEAASICLFPAGWRK